MKNMKKAIKLENVVYIALALYMLDVILLGTGELLKVDGISSRIIFFAIAVLGSIPFILKNVKNFFKNREIMGIAFFCCFVLLAGAYGLIKDNYMPILISDIKGYLNLLIIFPMLYVLSDKEHVLKIFKILLNSIFVISLICVILSYYQFFPADFKLDLYIFVHKIGWASLTLLTKTATRVFLHSGTRMLALGLILALAFLLIEKEKKILRIVQMTCCLVALYISYARAIYLGLFAMVVCLMVFTILYYKEYLQMIIKVAVCVLALTAGAIAIIGFTQNANLFEVGWNRCVVAVGGESVELEGSISTEDDNSLVNIEAEKESLNIRDYRISMALENFGKSPIWGNGLGVVNDLNYYTGIEYFYLDLLSKMGIIGLILFIAPAILTLITIIKNRNVFTKEQKILAFLMWLILMYLMIISYFNPCMNTSWGLMIYALAITISIPWDNAKDKV